MSVQKLEETQRAIESLEKLDADLSQRIILARQEAAREESQQYLLQFELSQMNIEIQRARDEEEKLQTEKKRLIDMLAEKTRLAKEMQNLNIVSNMLMQTKTQEMAKLKEYLETIDFQVEVSKGRYSGTVECFTQHSRF